MNDSQSLANCANSNLENWGPLLDTTYFGIPYLENVALALQMYCECHSNDIALES